MAYALVRTATPVRMSLDAFAARAGVHPELLRRLVRLGLLDPYVDPAGQLWFPPAQLATLARARRLRAGLSLNYAALGVVLDLLSRIEELEAALRARRAASSWTAGGSGTAPTSGRNDTSWT
jgi:DNA-binding transcriptional MerR regulator